MTTSAPPPRRRRPLRTALLALGVVVVLGAAAVGFYAFVGNHWFVRSVDGGDVGVYRGINASLVGLDLYRLDTPTDLALTDLTQAARSRVESGIEADDRDDADRILSNLLEQRLPECRTVSTTPTTTAPTTTAPSTAATSTPAPGSGAPTTDPGVTAPPTTTTAPTTSTTSSSARTQEPGVDCREAD